METTSHVNGPHSLETPERQEIHELKQIIKACEAALLALPVHHCHNCYQGEWVAGSPLITLREKCHEACIEPLRGRALVLIGELRRNDAEYDCPTRTPHQAHDGH